MENFKQELDVKDEEDEGLKLCNDDYEKYKIKLDDLENYYDYQTEFWRIKIMLERDSLVKKIEQKLNKEHVFRMEELKEKLRLKREF